ncbi:MAG: two-component system, NarL family, sensor histidine kinase UhpB [Thermoleophilaceae bacterium]|nr:two-component system, NarL family, sensor histidine kinase UhpB [Thermoleophilaceae bacterium]
MNPRRDSNSLAGQVIAANVLMVVATLFAAGAATHLNLKIQDERLQFGLLGLSIVLVLLVNMLMLRRRFSPLDRLIDRIEAIDPADPADFEAAEPDATEEIDRLAASFRRMLSRIDDERKRSGRLVLRAQEEERRRLARDLHDEVNQSLTAILLRLEALNQSAGPDVEDEIGEVKRLVNQAMDELLKLARQLRPSALDDHGLTSAIVGQVRRFSSQTGIKADVTTSGEATELESDQEIAAYRFAQEALSNIAQHADASRVEVDLSVNGHGLELRIEDDGRGFDPAGDHGGIGLSGMHERARLVGARLEVASRPGHGTALTLQVP